MSHVPDRRSLGRLYWREAATTITALIAKRWPHVEARYEVLSYEGGKYLLMVTVDARKLQVNEPLSELVCYFNGCVEALAEFGHAEVAPEVPF